jgi:hypothetical protein
MSLLNETNQCDSTTVISEKEVYNINTYQNRFKFVLLPPWVQDAVTTANKGPETMVDPIALRDILSRADVENYILLNTSSYMALKDFPLADLLHRCLHGGPSIFNYLDSHDVSTIGNVFSSYNQHALPEKFGTDVNAFLFNYFADSEMVSESLESYYITITPLYNDVVAIRINRADATENVIEKQVQALRDWIIIAGDYVEFNTIANSIVFPEYLNWTKKLLNTSKAA